MFNLERAISDWRRQMATSAVTSNPVLDELENHLREEIRMLTSAGMPESQAFRLAVSRLGDSTSLRDEFHKLDNSFPQWLASGPFLWTALNLVLTIVVAAMVLQAGQQLLLLAHILTLTVGYGAAFFAGALGLCYFTLLCIGKETAARQLEFSRIAMFSVRGAACLITAGLVLGMVWSAKKHGLWLSGDPREIGTLCALIWVGGVSLIPRFWPMDNNATMMLCIVGNAVVSLAWFGAGLMAHGRGIASSWVLNGALALNLLFVVLLAVSQVGSRIKRSSYV